MDKQAFNSGASVVSAQAWSNTPARLSLQAMVLRVLKSGGWSYCPAPSHSFHGGSSRLARTHAVDDSCTGTARTPGPPNAPTIRSILGICTTFEVWGMLQLPLDRWRITSHCPAGGHARERLSLTPWAALPHAARAATVALRTDTSGRHSPRQSGLSRPLARPPEFGPESPGSSATWTPGGGNPSPTSDSRRQ
jgi:hypothetical protein